MRTTILLLTLTIVGCEAKPIPTTSPSTSSPPSIPVVQTQPTLVEARNGFVTKVVTPAGPAGTKCLCQ